MGDFPNRRLAENRLRALGAQTRAEKENTSVTVNFECEIMKPELEKLRTRELPAWGAGEGAGVRPDSCPRTQGTGVQVVNDDPAHQEPR